MSTGEEPRKSAIAGTWYPGDPRVLRTTINDFFRKVTDEPPEGRIVGLVVPHAGYVYSGQVAAHAYKLIMGRSYDAAIVIGPSHRVPFRGVSLYDRGGYETPLGTLPLDRPLAEKLVRQSPLVSALPQPHRGEHSIEIQLPFLQVALGDVPFVPLLMGSQDRETCRGLAAAIAAVADGRRLLLVGSSDLSHFHGYDQAVKLDSLVLSHLERMDDEGLLRDLEQGRCEACGGGPTAVVMMAAKKLGARKSRLLTYANSGDVTGDRSGVVGYAACVIYADGAPQDGRENPEPEGELSGTEKQILRDLARHGIESVWNKTGRPEESHLPERLKLKRGAFVTLKKQGSLRGCIGYIEGIKPLYKTVQEMAAAAAFHDPRFPPLAQKEWQDVSMEISVLSPLRRIEDREEIEVGRHGLYIRNGTKAGLLLPQVAAEHHWDRTTFLRETCRKAGLGPEAWKDPASEIFIFSADIF